MQAVNTYLNPWTKEPLLTAGGWQMHNGIRPANDSTLIGQSAVKGHSSFSTWQLIATDKESHLNHYSVHLTPRSRETGWKKSGREKTSKERTLDRRHTGSGKVQRIRRGRQSKLSRWRVNWGVVKYWHRARNAAGHKIAFSDTAIRALRSVSYPPAPPSYPPSPPPP